ncbi:MAG: GAF domain-containing sensor histidine kinase [Actinomycetia bacterium]|nr:GAF domain-containing sensor histidine kinase [Actinomycetes bacterium]
MQVSEQQHAAGRVRDWFSRLRDGDRARYVPGGPPGQEALILALNEVAASASAARTVHDVLNIIVDAAKRFTDTEKVVLALVDDSGALTELDESSIVVRGCRLQHDEAWWGAWLLGACDHVFSDGEAYFEVNASAGAWCLAVPVRVQDRPLGILCTINSISHRLRQDQTAFLSILGAFAAASIENARLAEESRYALLASERERISREMHDGIAQSLFSISLSLEVCKRRVLRDPAAVARHIGDIQELLAASQGEIRRYIYDLRPAKLQELGLAGAIEYWLRELAPGKVHKVDLLVNGVVRHVGSEIEACVYRVAREATTNAVKHADADHIRVTLEYTADGVAVTVSDDGNGFDVDSATGASDAGSSMGLRTIRERVETAGGEIKVVSEPGCGCTIWAHIPS